MIAGIQRGGDMKAEAHATTKEAFSRNHLEQRHRLFGQGLANRVCHQYASPESQVLHTSLAG
jgi:hypothetical protein